MEQYPYQDVLSTWLRVGDRCLYIKSKNTSVGYALVEILELFEYECTVKCLIPNPTRDTMKGVYWEEGSIHKRIAYTNPLQVNEIF